MQTKITTWKVQETGFAAADFRGPSQSNLGPPSATHAPAPTSVALVHHRYNDTRYDPDPAPVVRMAEVRPLVVQSTGPATRTDKKCGSVCVSNCKFWLCFYCVAVGVFAAIVIVLFAVISSAIGKPLHEERDTQ